MEQFRYEPDVPIVDELIFEFRKVIDAIEMRNHLKKSFDRCMFSSFHGSAQAIMDEADQLVLRETKKIVKWIDENEIYEDSS